MVKLRRIKLKLQTAYDAYKGEIGITVLTIPVPALNNPEFYQVYVHQLHSLTSIKHVADDDDKAITGNHKINPPIKASHYSAFNMVLSLDDEGKPKEAHLVMNNLPDSLCLDIDGDTFNVAISYHIGPNDSRDLNLFLCRQPLTKNVSAGIRWSFAN